MLRSSPPLIFVIVTVGAILLLASVYHVNNGQLPVSITKYTSNIDTDANVNANVNVKADRPTFLELAQKHGTDKVTSHSYHHMYKKYLEPMRDKKIKMLEIGLGCNMAYGPGASYHLWLEYLPNVDLYYIEYDAKCAEKWKAKTTEAVVFTGDQADVPFLKEFIEKSGGNFDVIVDDGGHTMNQQLVSLDTLFPTLNPGGIYICEDLQTSYLEIYGGGTDNKKGTMMDRVRQSLNDMMERQARQPNMNEIWSIDCMLEVCAFSKKEPGEFY